MNNQFATQFLLSELDAYDSLRSMLAQLGAEEDSINILVKAVEMGALKPSETVEIVKKTLSIDEMTGSSGVGGGSTVGGGTTDGASWDPQGPTGTGEQYAAGTRRKKYQESTYEDDEIAIFDGGEDGITKIYKKVDGTYYGINDEFDFVAKDEQEMLHKLSQFGYKHLSGHLEEDAPRLAGDPSKTNKQGSKNLNAYSSVGFTKAPSAEAAGKKIKGVEVKDLWKEALGESRAYSKFKKETATRSKDQQMHEAVRMIHSRLAEVSKLLEYAQQMRNELSEGEQTLEYNHNTKKVFERINSKVVEIYSKTRQLK